MTLLTRGRAALRKNYAPLKTLLLGRYPPFTYAQRGDALPYCGIPVFHFHAVEESILEEKLAFLRENGYDSLDSSEWLRNLEADRPRVTNRVVLTFDDGDISLFRHAYPLLKKYDFRAISFICPALVPSEEDTLMASSKRKLCNWSEIREMHDSGHVDFQSHSQRHDLVFSSGRLTGFLHPRLESHYFGKNDSVLALKDGEGFSLTNIRGFESQQSPADYWGAPLFTLSPRLATDTRFICDPQMSAGLRDFARARGGVDFFCQNGWRKAMRQEFLRLRRRHPPGKFLTGKEHQAQNERELRSAADMIERMLPGKSVRHLGAPWYMATKATLTTAFSAGIESIFLGADGAPSEPGSSPPNCARSVQRLPSSFIFRLPGTGRRTLHRALLDPA